MTLHKAMWVPRARTLAFWLLALLVATTIGMPIGAKPAHAATFTVNSTGDAGDANPEGVCDSAPLQTETTCTLREAIQEANANDNAPTVDLIHFAIPTAGPHTISPDSSALPDIVEPVTIDGYTESLGESTPATPNTLAFGTNAVLKIVISGASAPAGSDGLSISSGGTTIRGLVINGFTQDGLFFGGTAIVLAGTSANTNNRIEGNFIGTNAAGTAAVQNEAFGLDASGFELRGGNIIGGTTPASRNLISGNGGTGVILGSDANSVRGNLIGTNANGTSTPNDLGNGTQGINVTGDNNLISDNVIAFNDSQGAALNTTAVGNRILTNSIFSNTFQGIELAGGGREQDNKDPDTGANNKQNFPTLTSATSSGMATTVSGSLNSKPRKTFTIQFFSNPALINQGKTFLGQLNVRTNRKGKASFSYLGPAVEQGQQITATATGSEGTSEFSDEVGVGTAS